MGVGGILHGVVGIAQGVRQPFSACNARANRTTWAVFRGMGRQSNGVVKAGGHPAAWAHQQPGVKEQRWPGTWMALGIFFASSPFLWLGPRTLVPGQLW